MTKIMIMTIGSRGDIQPFVALGKRLLRDGYEVVLQTAESYSSFVEAHGVPYAYMSNEFIELAETPQGKAATAGGGKMQLMKKVMPMLRTLMADEWQAAQAFQPDAIVYHAKTLGAYHIGEKLNIPIFNAIPLPLYTPTRAYPLPIVSGVHLGGAVNRLTYSVMNLVTARYMGVINDFRVNTLNLPKRGRFSTEELAPSGDPIPVLYAYSAHVVPRPADYPPNVQVTGYWFLDETPDWQPSPELVRFLADGAPPVYIGFGSMSGGDPRARTQIILDALAKSGQRGVLASGWGGLEKSQLPASVFMLDQMPHEWLFPRVSAVVHHGGAGTTAAGLRAGKPTVIVPFLVDQPFWGRMVHELGVGVAPIPQKNLTADSLAEAMRFVVKDAPTRQRAEALGVKIRAEDGLGKAVSVIRQALPAKV